MFRGASKRILSLRTSLRLRARARSYSRAASTIIFHPVEFQTRTPPAIASRPNAAIAEVAEECEVLEASHPLHNLLLEAIEYYEYDLAISIFQHIKHDAPLRLWYRMSTLLLNSVSQPAPASSPAHTASVFTLRKLMKQHGLNPDHRAMPMAIQHHARLLSGPALVTLEGLSMSAKERRDARLNVTARERLLYLVDMWHAWQAQHSGQVDARACEFLLEAHCKLGQSDEVHTLTELMIKHCPNSLTLERWVSVMDMLKSSPDVLERYFTQHVIHKPNLSSGVFIPLLHSLCLAKQTEKLESWFSHMSRDFRVSPCAACYHIMLVAFRNVEQYGKVFEYYKQLLSSEVEPTVPIFQSMIDVAVQLDDFPTAIAFYRSLRMHGLVPNLAIYNRFTEWFIAHGDPTRLALLMRHVTQADVKPGIKFWNKLISSFARQGFVHQVLIIIQHLEASGLSPDHKTECALLNAYAEAGDIDAMMQKYLQLREQGRLVGDKQYNIVLKGLAKRQRSAEIEQVYRHMIDDHVPITLFTIMSCMQGQATMAGVDKYWNIMEQNDLEPNAFIYSVRMNKLLEIEGGRSSAANARVLAEIADMMKEMHMGLFRVGRGKFRERTKELERKSTNMMLQAKGIDVQEAPKEKESHSLFSFFFSRSSSSSSSSSSASSSSASAALSSSSSSAESYMMFKLRQPLTPDVVHWTALIRAIANVGDRAGLERALHSMQHQFKVQPGLAIHNTLLRFYAARGLHERLAKVVAEIKESKNEENKYTLTALRSYRPDEGYRNQSVEDYYQSLLKRFDESLS